MTFPAQCAGNVSLLEEFPAGPAGAGDDPTVGAGCHPSGEVFAVVDEFVGDFAVNELGEGVDDCVGLVGHRPVDVGAAPVVAEAVVYPVEVAAAPVAGQAFVGGWFDGDVAGFHLDVAVVFLKAEVGAEGVDGSTFGLQGV